MTPTPDKQQAEREAFLRALETEVHCAIGHASVCWKRLPESEFDSDEALKVGDHLMQFIRSNLSDAQKKEGEAVLPEDVTVCGNTFCKGVKLSTFILVAKGWHKAAYPDLYTLTDEQKAENFRRLTTPPAAAAQAVPMTHERYLAIREGHFNAAAEEYFGARPQIDTNPNRRIFYAGHCKGYDAATPTDSTVNAGAVPKFDKTYCSQCGKEFGPGNAGFSDCREHHHRDDVLAEYIAALEAADSETRDLYFEHPAKVQIAKALEAARAKVATWSPEKRASMQLEGTDHYSTEAKAQPLTDEVEQYIVNRYQVVKTGHGFWPYCVKVVDGEMELFIGHKAKCEEVAAALQTACLDGAFIAIHGIASSTKEGGK